MSRPGQSTEGSLRPSATRPLLAVRAVPWNAAPRRGGTWRMKSSPDSAIQDVRLGNWTESARRGAPSSKAQGLRSTPAPTWKPLDIIYYHHSVGLGLCLPGGGFSPKQRELLETT